MALTEYRMEGIEKPIKYLFVDNFERNYEPWWRVVDGSWNIISTDQVLQDAAAALVWSRIQLLHGFDWTDYILKAKWNIVAGDEAHFHVRNQNRGNLDDGYSATVRPNGWVDIYRIVGGTYTSIAAVNKGALATNTWHTVTFECRGSFLKLWIDGREYLEVFDNRWSRGSIGLQGRYGAAVHDIRFDDVEVYVKGVM